MIVRYAKGLTSSRPSLFTNSSRLYGLYNTVYDDKKNSTNKLLFFPTCFFIHSPSLNAQSIELISLRKLPDSFRYSLDGIVASRAVKFLGKLHSTLVDKETRDSWWEGLRDEVRANTLRIGADLVLGYRETCSIHGDICVLSATGTAVKLDVLAILCGLSYRKLPRSRKKIRCSCEAVVEGDLFSCRSTWTLRSITRYSEICSCSAVVVARRESFLL